jgi:hypothetical protein
MADTRLTARPQPGVERTLYLVAGVILVGGLTVAGVIAASGPPDPAPAGQPAAPVEAARSTTASTSTTASSSSSTCGGWATVKSDMQGMTKLPDGWTYDTPQIDITIHGRAAQLDKILPLFVDEITPEPADLAATAHAWVDAQSVEAPKLTDHTFTPADRAAIDAAAHALDVACGMT